MAKVIKFALELKNGEQARTMEDLRAHFDIEKIVAYFLNGRLVTWLRHRHLDAEADAVEILASDDAELAKKLCGILGVAYEEHQTTGEAIDANALKESHERMNTLRQITSDPEILTKIDRVAFNEKDLRRLAFDNESDVYLCNGRFVIPLNVQNKHYIGVGKSEAVIASEEWIDFEERHIQFTNIQFNNEYQIIAEVKRQEEQTKNVQLLEGDKESNITVMMTDDDGNEYYYTQEIVLQVNCEKYALLVPIHETGCNDDDDGAFFAKIVLDENGEEVYIEPTDDEFEEVSTAYSKLFEDN